MKGSGYYPFDFKNGNDINNSNDTFCWFENLDVKTPMKVISATRAKCVVPPNTLQLDSTWVEVLLNNRDVSDDNVPYFYYKPAKIHNIDPREGPTRGGTVVMVYGDEFQPGKKVNCNFGDQQVKGKYVGMGQIKCVAPKVEKSGIVKLTISYEGEDEKMASEAKDYLYYDTPGISAGGVKPECGPFSGYTQLTIKGKNFSNMGFGKVKCVFNETITMNATILSEEEIKCDTPPLSLQSEALEP